MRPLSSTLLHKILELLLMYLISLSQRHNAASVLELSRSLEFEHELRREVTLQVMRWFEQVDEADERWKMGVEKAVCQVGLGILRRWMVDFERLISFIFALIPRLIPTLFLVLYLQSDPISEDEFMTMKYRRRRCFYFQQIPQATHNENRETISAHLRHFPPRKR